MWRQMCVAAGTPARRGSSVGIRRAVVQFAASGLAALILLGAAAVYELRQTGASEPIRNAKEVTALAAHGVVEPNLTSGLADGSPAAVARLDRAVHGLLTGRVVRVKIWTADGRILYSDDHRLIGTSYPLGEDEQDNLRSGAVEAEVSDLSRPENRFERKFKKLLEVYLPITGPDGKPLLFETYERYASVRSGGRRLWTAFLPAILGTLALLWLVQVPLAWRAARRLSEGQAARAELLRSALESSEVERRRIARDLHDGAVQDLAGVSYSLTAAADTVSTSSREETEATMREAAAGTRRTIKELRTLLVDIYPPDLHRTGLEAALRDLVAPLGPRGIEGALEVEDGLVLPPAVELLFFRCAQEALRNTAVHSQASRVDVRVVACENGQTARLTVEDDGVGFDGDGPPEGHFGLRVLSDLAREAGGRLERESTPGEGTRLCVEAPL